MPKPGCSGRYRLVGGTVFKGTLDCRAVGGGRVTQEIDLRGVDPADLRAEDGALVSVRTSVLPGDEPIPFRLYRRDKPYLE